MKNGWYEKHGDLFHYVNDKRHNEKGPARIYNNGNKFWLQNNKYHRLDGSACEYFNGSKYWYYQDEPILNVRSEQEFKRYLKLKSLW